VRAVLLATFAVLAHSLSFAEDDKLVMNFDLNTLSPDGSVAYSIQQQGIHLSPGKPFHGTDLGNFDYFLTASKAEDGKAKLTIEFYEYETRRKMSDVISDIVDEVDITLGTPARFEGASATFGVDLAFMISREQKTFPTI
jgi:hypothetical protein